VKTAYFILGMHRSGTSALGGVLSLMGLEFGTDLMAGNEGNPKGYFENNYVYRLNNQILNENNSNWDDYTFKISNISKEKLEEYIVEAKKIILSEFKYANTFAIKDPRICYLYPIWEKACVELGIDIKVILPYRNPIEVAQSLKKRNDFSYEKSLLLWTQHFLSAEYFSKNIQRMFLSFDELIEDRENSLKKLKEFTSVSISSKVEKLIEDFLDKNIKHNNISINNVNKDIPFFLSELITLIINKEFDNKNLLKEIAKEFQYSLEFFITKEMMDERKFLLEKLEQKELELREEKKLHTFSNEKRQETGLALKEERTLHSDTKILLSASEEKYKKNETEISRLKKLLLLEQEKLKKVQNTLNEKEELLLELRDVIQISKDDIEKEKEENKRKTLEFNEITTSFENTIRENEILYNQSTLNIEHYHALYSKYIGSRVKTREVILKRLDRKSSLLKNFNPLAIKRTLSMVKNMEKNIVLFDKKFHKLPWNLIENFDEKQYLNLNGDIANAVQKGEFESGFEHFILYGFNEVYLGKRSFLRHIPKHIKSKLSRSDEEDLICFTNYLQKYYNKSRSTLSISSQLKKDILSKKLDGKKLTLGEKIFKCNIEQVNASGIRGWIYNLQKTQEGDLVNLSFVFDDEASIEIKNSYDRADIKKAFKVKCKSGFYLDVPVKYLDGKEHKLKIFAKLDNENHLISEKTFSQKNVWLEESITKGKKILFVSHNLRSQGAQNSLFELAIGLRRLYGITPVIYSPSGGALEEKYREHNIKVIVDKSFNVGVETLKEWDEQINLFSEKVKQLNCDAMVVNTLLSFYMIHVAKHIGIASIFIPRESEPPKQYFDYLAQPIRKLAKSSFNLTSQVVFVADATRNLWSFMDNDNSFKTIHNSLNTALLNRDSVHSRHEIRKAFNIDDNDIVLLSLGTVTERKGQLDFVKSLQEIMKKSTKPIKAFIVGMDIDRGDKTQEYSKKVYKIIEEYPKEIQENIFLIPETDKQKFTKPYEFYAMADIYVFTSRIESFPRVMLEALYFGLPVVSTPCFGVVEQCIEEYNVLYYKEEDVAQLSTHLLTLIEDNKKRKLFSEASKELFKNMQTYDQMIINYHEVIKSIVKKEK